MSASKCRSQLIVFVSLAVQLRGVAGPAQVAPEEATHGEVRSLHFWGALLVFGDFYGPNASSSDVLHRGEALRIEAKLRAAGTDPVPLVTDSFSWFDGVRFFLKSSTENGATTTKRWPLDISMLPATYRGGAIEGRYLPPGHEVRVQFEVSPRQMAEMADGDYAVDGLLDVSPLRTAYGERWKAKRARFPCCAGSFELRTAVSSYDGINRDLHELMRALLQDADRARMDQIADKVLRKAPNSVVALHLLAAGSLRRNEYRRAKGLLERLQAVLEDNLDTGLNLTKEALRELKLSIPRDIARCEAALGQ